MAAVCPSIRSRCIRVKNAWCSLNRPVSASVSTGIFDRIRRCARSANTTGSRSPSTRACSIARLETPVMSEATAESLIPASSSSFSSRKISRDRSRMIKVRVRVRSRNSRTGCGGTNEARTRPCAPNCASHAASETSLLRPGMLRTCRALTSTRSNPAFSSR